MSDDQTKPSPVLLHSEVEAIFRRVIKDEARISPHVCRFDISDTQTKQLNQYLGSFTRLSGDNDIGKAFEVTIENHKWLYKLRRRGDKVMTALYIFVFVALVGGGASLLWQGVISKVIHGS